MDDARDRGEAALLNGSPANSRAYVDRKPSDDAVRAFDPENPDAGRPRDRAANDGTGSRDRKADGSFLRRHPLLVVAGAILLIGVVVAGVIWWLNARHYESTDDAFIDARQFGIAPKVSGYIAEVPVTDNQTVGRSAACAHR